MYQRGPWLVRKIPKASLLNIKFIFNMYFERFADSLGDFWKILWTCWGGFWHMLGNILERCLGHVWDMFGMLLDSYQDIF